MLLLVERLNVAGSQPNGNPASPGKCRGDLFLYEQDLKGLENFHF